MSIKHPLGKLYQWVDVDKYWNYIYNLCVQSQPHFEKQNKDVEENKK